MTEPVTVRLLHVPAGHIMPPAPLIAAVRLARSRAKVCAGLRARITAARMAGCLFCACGTQQVKACNKKRLVLLPAFAFTWCRRGEQIMNVSICFYVIEHSTG